MNVAPNEIGAANLRRDAGRGDPKKCDCLAAVGSTNSPTGGDVQRLRAGWVSRRFLLPASMASAVAALAFQTVEAR